MADFTVKGNKDVYRFKIEQINEEDISRSGKFAETFTGMALIAKEKIIIKRLGAQHKNNPAAIRAITNEYKIQAEGPLFPKVFDFFEFKGAIYLVREFIEGLDLKHIFESSAAFRKLTLTRKLELSFALLDVLGALHRQGIIHRDLRPGNILIKNWEDFKKGLALPQLALIDLGLAIRKEEIPAETQKSPFALIYSPPEQLLNFNYLVGEWSDLFSLGLIVYELFSGAKAYYHDNPEFLMNLQLNAAVKKDKDIPEEIFQIVLKATERRYFTAPPSRMQKEEIESYLKEGITKRYQSVSEMRQAFEQINQEALLLKEKKWWKWF